ncbi:MAG TPA: [acyl-carrier-protein] S-malonyltransferase [Marinobacter hydrocarbonoclasticus]|jgi:[acyl-carrier-protein] S-malonyltransferase|uniref:Malonyl CoA-acyl carrier protein transacylase n=1 Tax=Marinobacter nauticus TaxID=2743 RepID=A0A368VAD1_MARNT|nr:MULTISPECIES: ACP S-malonyltransferase [Marinobacter]MEC9038981.1 ACP S-malonyltransferase [Pseudomonadota bacterium]MAC23259.1 [acyl-carrier-protein] S-malonyltransferase [Marinobacter sp.]MBH91376.1 [acyl-carrier-protein] S-malonyltransferase [Marinobacter sp.]MBN8237854.1 ACP S-malonyltransferase [Marinobacter nauticus]MBW3196729.1 ACP S-malonyltransferase [Marinobacter nauticus]|tara:strand:+ start:383 stop:1321 length:939 start_codon:yes stop_codon:yes gene_type:complete
MKSAFVFPGQGSQSLGMLSAAAEAWPMITETFDEASNVLGYDLWHLCQHGPAEELNKTMVTQPALLTASVALWRQWCVSDGPRPDFVAGHSLGEYSALVAAESLDFIEAVKLVQLRGELMQDAVPEGQGRMAAILGLEDSDVVSACEESAEGDVVAAVNFNAPGQVVIAGSAAAVERAIEACKAKGARKAMPLPVSVPSHCALMKGAAEQLAEALEDIRFNDAVIPVVQNVNAEPARDAEVLKANLLKQLYSPVLWTNSVQRLSTEGVGVAVECGAGKVLAGLIKRIDRSLPVHGIESPDSLAEALKAFGQS